MQAHEHSTFREGAVTGIIGGLIMAVWYLIVDTVAGQPLRTPNALGKIFFRGDLTPGLHVAAGPVIGYTIVHFVIFVLLGMGLTLLVHLATRNWSLRMGVWFGLVIAFAWAAGHVYMLGVASGERLSPWAVVIGSLLGVFGMAAYLWRRHPGLSRSFHEAPLGSESQPPPHPPGGPRAA